MKKIILVLIFLIAYTDADGQQINNTVKTRKKAKRNNPFRNIEPFKDCQVVEYNTRLEKYDGQEFSISIIKRGEDRILIFQKIVYSGNTSTPQILDTLNIGRLKKDQFIGYTMCRKDGKIDCEIIAVIIAEHKEYCGKVIKAWRADRKQGKIYPIDKTGIDYFNEFYGV